MPYVITTNSTTSSTNEWTSALDQQIWTAWSAGVTWSTGTTASTTGSVVVQLGNAVTANSLDTAIWSTWNAVMVQATNQAIRHLYHRTPEQVAADRETRIQAEAEHAKAREKAETLLRECLSPKQREELALHGHFHLETIAQSGERRRYRIERGRSRNVRQVTPEGRIIKTLCMHPVMNIPDADTMLAQKLYLEGAEDEFLRIANHS